MFQKGQRRLKTRENRFPPAHSGPPNYSNYRDLRHCYSNKRAPDQPNPPFITSASPQNECTAIPPVVIRLHKYLCQVRCKTNTYLYSPYFIHCGEPKFSIRLSPLTVQLQHAFVARTLSATPYITSYTLSHHPHHSFPCIGACHSSRPFSPRSCRNRGKKSGALRSTARPTIKCQCYHHHHGARPPRRPSRRAWSSSRCKTFTRLTGDGGSF
jgi:hypothetical protein